MAARRSPLVEALRRKDRSEHTAQGSHKAVVHLAHDASVFIGCRIISIEGVHIKVGQEPDQNRGNKDYGSGLLRIGLYLLPAVQGNRLYGRNTVLGQLHDKVGSVILIYQLVQQQRHDNRNHNTEYIKRVSNSRLIAVRKQGGNNQG